VIVPAIRHTTVGDDVFSDVETTPANLTAAGVIDARFLKAAPSPGSILLAWTT
jgi:hypothetical protein